jgi:hypothetical protein
MRSYNDGRNLSPELFGGCDGVATDWQHAGSIVFDEY